MKLLIRNTAVLAALLALGGVAQAGPITSVTIDDCDAQGCEGTSLFLSVEDNMDGTFSVIQRINSTGFSEVRAGLNQVGFKAIKDWTAADLISAPTAGWLDPPLEANTSSGGLCTTGTNSGKVCTHGFVDITTDAVYTWEFLITGGTILDPADWHWGAQLANAAGPARGKIISAEPTGVIPEPSAAVLFGLGALIVSGRTRRS